MKDGAISSNERSQVTGFSCCCFYLAVEGLKSKRNIYPRERLDVWYDICVRGMYACVDRRM